MIPKIEALWAARDTLSFVALGITAATVAVILLLRRWRPRWPVLVIAVAAASLASGWFHLPVDTVASRFGALPSGLPAPHWPEITQARLIEMLPSAFVIAFLAGVESLLSRSEEHTSELQSLMRISYAVFCLKKKNQSRR